MSTLFNQTDNSKLYELCKLKIMGIEPKCGVTKSRHEIIISDYVVLPSSRVLPSLLMTQ